MFKKKTFFFNFVFKTLRTFMFVPDISVVTVTWVKILLKCACGQEEAVQLGDLSRGFGCPANGKKVIDVNLWYFSA